MASEGSDDAMSNSQAERAMEEARNPECVYRKLAGEETRRELMKAWIAAIS